MAARGVLRVGEGGRLLFWCPGCDGAHQVQVGGGPGPRWGFNGDYDRPTFTPSVLVRMPDPDRPGTDIQRCHSFVRDGQIQFLGDCTHALAGHTVALKPFDEA